MKIPAFLNGKSQKVKSESNKIMTKLKRGMDFTEVVAGPMINTRKKTGLIVLHGPSPLVGGQEHFNLYWIHRIIHEKVNRSVLTEKDEKDIFYTSIKTDWGTLCLTGWNNQMWFAKDSHSIKEEWGRLFLKSVIKYWECFLAEGSRYSNGSNTGGDLWRLSTTIKYVLANFGVPTDVLNNSLPQGGLAQLVKVHKILDVHQHI